MAKEPPPTAIVTGAAGAIGRELCAAVSARGARVLVVDRDADAAESVARELIAGGGTAESYVADVADEESSVGYVRAALDLYGRVDWYANNAGIEGPAAEIGDFPPDAFRRVLDVNVTGVFLGLRAVLPVMRRQGGGRIVNTASVAGLYATPKLVAYGASKHAVIGITRTAAIENAGHGIAVNAVCPGPQYSRMMDSIERSVRPDDPAGMRREYTTTVPMGRYGYPSEVAATVAWLFAEAPHYLTGQNIVIDGGLLVA
jgi:3alpha(or 20beta)-hydroxysteroid dehydrogenase